MYFEVAVAQQICRGGRSPSLFSHRLGGVLELEMAHTSCARRTNHSLFKHRLNLVGSFERLHRPGYVLRREGFRLAADSQYNATQNSQENECQSQSQSRRNLGRSVDV
jgi:hypothetical protein